MAWFARSRRSAGGFVADLFSDVSSPSRRSDHEHTCTSCSLRWPPSGVTSRSPPPSACRSFSPPSSPTPSICTISLDTFFWHTHTHFGYVFQDVRVGRIDVLNNDTYFFVYVFAYRRIQNNFIRKQRQKKTGRLSSKSGGGRGTKTKIYTDQC